MSSVRPREAGVAGEDGAAGAGPGDDAGDVPGAVADQRRPFLRQGVTTISPHSPSGTGARVSGSTISRMLERSEP